jgi:long-chain acyl-CoA synthetase
MIVQQFRATAAAHCNQVAIVDGNQRITYGQLLHEVDRARNWLQSTLRVDNGCVVAASLRNSWQFVACFFAVAELGGIFLLCNPIWRAAELRRVVERLGIRGVITEEQLRAEWDQIADALPADSILTIENEPLDPPARADWQFVARSADAPLVYLLTSGSTGTPKVVPRSNRNLGFGARNVASALDIVPGMRWLSALPFHHAWGFSTSLLIPLLHGATLILMAQFNAVQCLDLIRAERAELMMASPFIYGLLADRVSDPAALSTLRCCYWAGSLMANSVAETWRDRLGIRLRSWYGMSETHSISFDRADLEPLSKTGAFVGSPIPGVEVRVLGPDGSLLGPEQNGELAVRSDGVMVGYVGEPESKAGSFSDGFFRTGDVGYLDSAGQLFLTGRMRRVINVAGSKVDPVEVERAVESIAGVAECHVDAAPAGRTGELIRARIVVRAGHQVNRRDVIEHCRQQLAEYKLPRIIDFVDAAPGLISGKMAQ